MTLELAERGYDMTGIDYSPDMLDIARNASEEAGHDVLWLCQDMREFELYGTVDATVSCLDCINHLLSVQDLEKCFSLVHNYLIPDGIFIFDINGRSSVHATRNTADERGAGAGINIASNSMAIFNADLSRA